MEASFSAFERSTEIFLHPGTIPVLVGEEPDVNFNAALSELRHQQKEK